MPEKKKGVATEAQAKSGASIPPKKAGPADSASPISAVTEKDEHDREVNEMRERTFARKKTSPAHERETEIASSESTPGHLAVGCVPFYANVPPHRLPIQSLACFIIIFFFSSSSSASSSDTDQVETAGGVQKSPAQDRATKA